MISEVGAVETEETISDTTELTDDVSVGCEEDSETLLLLSKKTVFPPSGKVSPADIKAAFDAAAFI